MNKQTIKTQVIAELIKRKKMYRREIVDFVLQLNGNTPANKSGYYGTNIQQWESELLIAKVSKGLYKPGKRAAMYVNEPDKYKETVLKDRINRLEATNARLLNEIYGRTQSIHQSSNANELKYYIEIFIKDFSMAVNKSRLLYADMVWQEELFDLQEEIINVLYKSHQQGLFTARQLMYFEHVFSTQTQD